MFCWILRSVARLSCSTSSTCETKQVGRRWQEWMHRVGQGAKEVAQWHCWLCRRAGTGPAPTPDGSLHTLKLLALVQGREQERGTGKSAPTTTEPYLWHPVSQEHHICHLACRIHAAAHSNAHIRLQ